MSNQLKKETSSYLLQHAENPVYWYPWGEEAFQKAKAEDKPIFLSIGYSTCHWCHVMAHESFEDEKTAELLNRYFVSIKVDREERPDNDSVYMAVCQEYTGSGGWPMSIFMTWDKKPFFAGTYFPIKSRYGMPGFSDLLMAIVNRWKESRNMLLESYDGAIPSGNSVMMYNLVRLSQLTESPEYDTLIKRQMEFMEHRAAEYPAGHSMYLLAKLLYENPPEHINVVLKNEEELGLLWGKLPFLANVTVVSDSAKYPLMNEKTTYYVCKNNTCLSPKNEL